MTYALLRALSRSRSPAPTRASRGAAVVWVGSISLLYALLGLPLAFASLYLTKYLAVIFTAPVLPAVSLTRLGLHPIAAVAVTFLAYWAAGFGVIEWRAHHRQQAGKHAVLIAP